MQKSIDEVFRQCQRKLSSCASLRLLDLHETADRLRTEDADRHQQLSDVPLRVFCRMDKKAKDG
jgi:hypothetical protein